MVQDPKSDDAPSTGQGQEIEAPVDVDKEIKDNMGAGKKHLLCSDYPEAVACFQDACTLLSNKHGQMAQECSDAYYYYGVSLLELARLENGVLGNALKGVPEDEDESDKDEEQFEKADLPEGEREKLREEVEAAMATEDEDAAEEETEGKEGEKQEKESSTEKEKGDEETKPKDESKTTEEPKQKEEKGEECAKPETSEPPSSKSEPAKEDEAEEDPDDISNMQLAWEMLELAKVLYKKREKSKPNSLMIAQCHLKLGELGLEVENYPQAIGDFLECLVAQKEHLPETDRKLAETHYNLGLAYSFEKRYDNALEHYQNALNVLESRVELLEELIENQEGEKEKESETIAECKEIGEIKELIPDINSKIEDVLLVKKQNEGRLEGSPFRQSAGETSTGFDAGTSGSQDKPCSSIPVRKVAPMSSAAFTSKDSSSDISHLVRRKRPSPDEEENCAESEGDSKKAKQEANGDGDKKNGTAVASNGHSAEKNGHSNGHSKTPEKAAEQCEDAAAALKKKMAAAGDAPVAMET
ncbi:protein HGV2-like isoform X1 [Styela clava]